MWGRTWAIESLMATVLVVLSIGSAARGQPGSVWFKPVRLPEVPQQTDGGDRQFGQTEELPVLPHVDDEEDEDDEISEIEERFDDLEVQIADLEDHVGSRAVVNAFDALQLDIGGFMTQTFTFLETATGNDASFDLTQFELFIKADVTEKWSLFTIIEFKRIAALDETDFRDVKFTGIENEAELEVTVANYRHSDFVQFQFGRFITPHGIINIEHFHPVLLNIAYPMFMRQERPTTFFQRFVVGAQMHGHKFVGPEEKNLFSYNLYVATEKKSGSEFLQGGRAAYGFSDWGVTVGANYGLGTHEALTTRNRFAFVGADLLIDKEKLLWKNEVYRSFEDMADHRLGMYTQPGWRINDKWIVFYRFDFLEPGRGLGDQREHVFGLNWLPTPLVRLRATATAAGFPGPRNDVQLLQLSGTVSF